LDLPATPGPNHPGGKISLGKDGYLYTVIGDLNNKGQLQNIKDGPEPNDSSVILRVNPKDGSPARDNPFLNLNNNVKDGQNQMDKYYAYGIRNSFGLAIDPLTGQLWDTENGDDGYDEINLVKPGFNSGWAQIMGPKRNFNNTVQESLINLPNSYYADPVLSWRYSIGVTDIEFLDSPKLGIQYQNNIFVGDILYGNLYLLEVNNTRTGLTFDNSDIQEDLVVDTLWQMQSIIFGTDFGGITDIETGPDGFLYILTFDPEPGQPPKGEGKIYRIVNQWSGGN
jgi:glucose/arabinose dehydrogenase